MWIMFYYIMIVVIINIFVLCKNILNLIKMWWYENKKNRVDIRFYWNCFCFILDYEIIVIGMCYVKIYMYFEIFLN